MDYIYEYEIKGTTPAEQDWDATGSVALRYEADDFVPMIQRAIAQAFKEIATGTAPIPGPYQITSLTLTLMNPAASSAKKQKAA